MKICWGVARLSMKSRTVRTSRFEGASPAMSPKHASNETTELSLGTTLFGHKFGFDLVVVTTSGLVRFHSLCGGRSKRREFQKGVMRTDQNASSASILAHTFVGSLPRASSGAQRIRTATRASIVKGVACRACDL